MVSKYLPWFDVTVGNVIDADELSVEDPDAENEPTALELEMPTPREEEAPVW